MAASPKGIERITVVLFDVSVQEYYQDDEHALEAKNIYEYLSHVMYHGRSNQNPLWNSLVVGGVKNGESYRVVMLGS